ncbi:MAG: EAL domain-containing protein [Treponemataceae bacterium]
MEKKTAKKTLLVVSDDKQFYEEILKLFKNKIDIVVKGTTKSAFEELEYDRYNQQIVLIVLDFDLPDDSAINFIENLKIDSVFEEIPVIGVASFFSQEKEIQYLKQGVADCIVKSFNNQAFFHKVLNFVNVHEISKMKVEYLLNDERNRLEDELNKMANVDELTGIFNKHSFTEATERMLKIHKDKNFVIIRFNIERFKVINDLFGSSVGDLILVDVANALKRIFTNIVKNEKNPEDNEKNFTETYGRLVADHFVACFEVGSKNIEQILLEIEKEIDVHALNYAVQIKVGVYKISDKSMDIDTMCDRANLPLQAIKGNYLKNIAYYDKTLRDVLLQEQEFVTEMPNALENNEFEIYLQPIVSIFEERIVGAEALVRWNHPKRGLLAPGGFVPFFEKSGLIAKLDQYVWTCAFAYQRERIKRKLPEISISVNISRMSLYNPHLCDDIINLSKKYEVPPKLLKLEITESAYNDNPEQLLCTMNALHKYGFIILMDDFGSGYSSLNMLKEILVDVLKIDMCFLQDFGKSPRSASILTSIVRMAKWLKIPVVCEGVETQNQLDFLKEIGCEFVQGFYYSKPVPISEFEELEKKKLCSKIPITSLVTDIMELNSIFDGNEFLSRLFNTFVGAIGFYEFTGNYLEVFRVNDNYHNIMNYTPLSFHSNKANVFEMVVPEDRQILLNACKSAAEGKMPGEIKIRRYISDGTVIWLSVVVRYIGGNEERSIVCCAMNNITEQKVSEARIKEQSLTLTYYIDFMRNVLDNVPYAVCQYTTHDEPKTLFANRACYKMYGINHPTDFIADKVFSELKLFSHADIDSFKKMLKRVKETGKAERYSADIIQRSGKVLSVKGEVSLLISHNGEMVFQDTFYEAKKESKV